MEERPNSGSSNKSSLNSCTPTSSFNEENAQEKLQQRGLKKIVTNRTSQDFFFIKVLGEGSFSTVYFAKEVDTGDEYAIKVLQKSQIRREKKVEYVIREKDVMAALTYSYGGHPFIVKLYCTFQDTDRLYFVLSYAKHGEMLDLLRRLGSFDESVTLFYASEIVYALEFLHKCGIIHRDLKPENILLADNWHIMITDFGTAKILGSDKDVPDVQKVKKLIDENKEDDRTNGPRNSFVGTAQYISPEVLKGQPVGPECDFWALGAIIFQMISGLPPFRAVNEYQILKKIGQLDYNFPDGFPEMPKDLVKRLLIVNPENRLGHSSTGGINALKNHTYFKNIEWDTLPSHPPPPIKPYVPASSGDPALYSDYSFPNDLEPGLNDAALNRLMGFGNINFAEQLEDSDDEIVDNIDENMAKLLEHNIIINQKLETQRRENKYHKFVDDNLILKAGLIDKKKGLFARRRMFLLTEGPRLFYVDPVNMELKGEVPLTKDLQTEAKNFRTFFVHTPKRTYYLFDPERRAKEWCDAIDNVRDRYFSGEHNILKNMPSKEMINRPTSLATTPSSSSLKTKPNRRKSDKNITSPN